MGVAAEDNRAGRLRVYPKVVLKTSVVILAFLLGDSLW